MHPWDAVITAAIHRTRPILLTAAAATLGMVPIAPTVFWARWPSRSSAASPSRRSTLVFLPALYVAWFRISEPRPAAVAAETAEIGNLVLQA
jgi:multidrug efflux pump subunit AcrB